MHTGLQVKCCYCETSLSILNLDELKNFSQPPPTSNFMKIQLPFPDCDMQTGGHVDKEKITSTLLKLFIATNQKVSGVPK